MTDEHKPVSLDDLPRAARAVIVAQATALQAADKTFGEALDLLGAGRIADAIRLLEAVDCEIAKLLAGTELH